MAKKSEKRKESSLKKALESGEKKKITREFKRQLDLVDESELIGAELVWAAGTYASSMVAIMEAHNKFLDQVIESLTTIEKHTGDR